MSGATTTLRRLRAKDCDDFRRVRLEGLRAHPEAFSASFEAENAQSPLFFADRLESTEVLGAFCDADLCGIAGLVWKPGAKQAHKAQLWGMYVCPAARQSGVGRQLVQACIAAATGRVELIQLNVIRSNQPAIRLYASLGFVAYGLEIDALKLDGKYYDEVLMARSLTPPRR